jgi:hypothetical protein
MYFYFRFVFSNPADFYVKYTTSIVNVFNNEGMEQLAKKVGRKGSKLFNAPYKNTF